MIYNGYETWKLDAKRCASFNFTNKKGTMCNRCVKSCPWSLPETPFHNLMRALVTRSHLARLAAIRGARLLDLGREKPEKKWWFNVRYKDGTLVQAK